MGGPAITTSECLVPLDLGEEHMVYNSGMAEETSRIVRAGKRTYFFDIKEAKTGEKYLVITESRFAGEDQQRARSKIMVFANAMDEFVKTLDEVAKSI
jgi:hypothetical protein